MSDPLRAACPTCKRPIKVSLIDLMPSMYPQYPDCDNCGARSRMAYPWTFSAHFISAVLAAVVTVNTLGARPNLVGLAAVVLGVYCSLAVALNWWYFKLGKSLVD